MAGQYGQEEAARDFKDMPQAVRSDGLKVVRTRLAMALLETNPRDALLGRERDQVAVVSLVVPLVPDVEVRAASAASYDALPRVTS